MAYDDDSGDFDDFDAPPSLFEKLRVPIFAASAVGAVALLGYLVLHGGKETSEKNARNLAEEQFKADPTSEERTAKAIAAAETAGDHAKGEEIKRRHQAAVASKGHAAEAALRDRLARDMKDGQALGQLVDLLLNEKRTDDARAAYETFVDADPTPTKKAHYGAFLWRNGYAEDAERVLRDALKAGDTSPHTHGFLGLALFDLGKKDEAKKELNLALDGDPNQDAVRGKLAILEPDDDGEEEKPSPPLPKAHKAKKSKKKK